jgi:hypothetical protein
MAENLITTSHYRYPHHCRIRSRRAAPDWRYAMDKNTKILIPEISGEWTERLRSGSTNI